MPNKLIVIKKRPDFVHAASQGQKDVKFGLVLQAVQSKYSQEHQVFRIGWTASKKVGNAVCRNKAKRRLRALSAFLLPKYAVVGYDYVLIARPSAVTRDYQDLYIDLKRALKNIKKAISEENENGFTNTEKNIESQ